MSRVRSLLLFSLVAATLSTGMPATGLQAGPCRPQRATAVQPQRVLDTRSGLGASPAALVGPGRAPLAVSIPAASAAALAIPVTVSQVRDGANTIGLRSSHGSTLVANVTLVLAGAPVPGGEHE